jgi:hypothetical protein
MHTLVDNLGIDTTPAADQATLVDAVSASA